MIITITRTLTATEQAALATLAAAANQTAEAYLAARLNDILASYVAQRAEDLLAAALVSDDPLVQADLDAARAKIAAKAAAPSVK